MLTISKKNQAINTGRLSIAAIVMALFAFTHPGKSHSAQVYFIAGDTITPVLQKVYIVSPDETKFIKLEDIRSAKELKIEDSKEGYRIMRFRITISRPGGYDDILEIINMGNRFNDRVINVLSNVSKKTFITIEDIRVVSRTGTAGKTYPKIINVID